MIARPEKQSSPEKQRLDDDFIARYGAGRPALIWRRVIADLETPVSAFLKLGQDQPYAFLLESVEGGTNLGRYSVLGLAPDLIWRCKAGRVDINRTADRDPRGPFAPVEDHPVTSLRALIAESRIDPVPGLPPMASGLFGYLGYDMIKQVENLPSTKPDALGIPDAILVRPTIVLVFDAIERDIRIITPVWPRAGVDAQSAGQAAALRLDEIVSTLSRALPATPALSPAVPSASAPAPLSNTGRKAYCAIVDRVKDYIRAGDAYQVVPSHRMSAPFTHTPLAFYRALRRLNPSPFLFLCDFDGFAVVGSSPEILVRLRDGDVTIRPLAGTRRRGADAAEDLRLAEELLADPKELSEHLMLLDLGRNDVGRVASLSSVRVTEKMAIERYSHVMHIVSNVTGRLKPGVDAVDALFAGFPAGTVSGAPKIRAMEIIDEVEASQRGVYGGSIGYFGSDGTLDTCIALRTAVLKDGVLYVQAGGGVVADSDPAEEYQETVNKAAALFRAAEQAVVFAEDDRNDAAAHR
jgi:anthranilate synthase component 1